MMSEKALFRKAKRQGPRYILRRVPAESNEQGRCLLSSFLVIAFGRNRKDSSWEVLKIHLRFNFTFLKSKQKLLLEQTAEKIFLLWPEDQKL